MKYVDIFEDKNNCNITINEVNGEKRCFLFDSIQDIEKFADELNAALIERDTYIDSDDGWIENTGVRPDYEDKIEVKFKNGSTRITEVFRIASFELKPDWHMSVTHWRPAR